MPIRPEEPGVPFTESAIAAHAPAAPGVYAIGTAREWIFVGEAENLQEQLLEHRRGEDTLAQRGATRFSFEVVFHGELRGARQHALLVQLCPRGTPSGA